MCLSSQVFLIFRGFSGIANTTSFCLNFSNGHIFAHFSCGGLTSHVQRDRAFLRVLNSFVLPVRIWVVLCSFTESCSTGKNLTKARFYAVILRYSPSWHLSVDVSPIQALLLWILLSCQWLPMDILQHLLSVIYLTALDYAPKDTYKLAAYSYDRLFLFQRILRPLRIILMHL